MGQHILVVDDELQIRELLAVYLGREGYRVSTAATSEETMRLLSESQVDLVVLDIRLEEEDGMDLLSKIKTQHPRLRVVMLTGLGFIEELLQEANQHGADGYVSKVLPLDELLLAIERALKPSKHELRC